MKARIFMKTLDELVNYVKEGEEEKAVECAEKIIEVIEPKLIIKALTKGMREMGAKFERKEIFIPSLLISSDALSSVMDIVEPRLGLTEDEKKKVIVIGTVEGDIHEIGKNILGIVLKAEGFEVIDLGTDVPPAKFISKAEEVNADVIGVSTLMTTTKEGQREVIKQLKAADKRDKYKVIIGGAPISQDWADEIEADAYCKDAFAGARYIKSL